MSGMMATMPMWSMSVLCELYELVGPPRRKSACEEGCSGQDELQRGMEEGASYIVISPVGWLAFESNGPSAPKPSSLSSYRT